MAEGYVYILFNRAFQNDHFKIGMTSKSSEERAREISNATGVPRAFEVLYEQRVLDCQRAERLLHQRLDAYRTSGNREFFHLPLKVAIRALEGVADEVGRLDEEQEKPPVDESAESTALKGEIEVAPEGDGRQITRRREGRILSFGDHLSYTDTLRQAILRDLRQQVLALDPKLANGEACTPGQRIAYRLPGNKIFLEVKVQKAAIVLHLADGGCPDPLKIADDIPASHGWRQLKKRITIINPPDLDAAMPFVAAAYGAEQ